MLNCGSAKTINNLLITRVRLLSVGYISQNPIHKTTITLTLTHIYKGVVTSKI